MSVILSLNCTNQPHLITEILPGKEEVEPVVQVLRRRNRLSGAVEVEESVSVLYKVTA